MCKESQAEGTQSWAHILALKEKVRGAKESAKSECRKLPVDNVESDCDIAAFRVFEQRIRTQVGMGEQQLNDAIA